MREIMLRTMYKLDPKLSLAEESCVPPSEGGWITVSGLLRAMQEPTVVYSYWNLENVRKALRDMVKSNLVKRRKSYRQDRYKLTDKGLEEAERLVVLEALRGE
jgi:DNA-binding transcriptional regulator PaaX